MNFLFEALSSLPVLTDAAALAVGVAALESAAPPRADAGSSGEKLTGWSSWRTLPLHGEFDLVYRNLFGTFSLRRVTAQDLKLGPGKTILGGHCHHAGGYRGFRADRIQRMVDVETGETVERNVIDWLLARTSRRRSSRNAA